MFWSHFLGFHFASKIKSSGRIFSIFASKNEGISCEVQTHFGSSLPASLTEKSFGRNSRCVHPKTKPFVIKFRHILEVLCLQVLKKKFWAQFHDLCVQKWSCLLWNFDAFWKFSACKFYRKSCGCNSTICAPKIEAVCCEIETHSGGSLPARFAEKVVGAIPQFMLPKTKLFAVEFRRILEVLCPQVSQKMFWAQFHDLCVQKRICLPWSSDEFWKFSASKIYRKSCGRNSTICASKNEAVCREIQTHSGSSLAARFYRKSSRRNSTICVSKIEAVCCEIETHSGSSLPERFTEKVVGAIPQFMLPKTKLFAVEFRRILEVLCLQILQKMFWAQFHELCVQKQSCFLWSSGAFWKFSASKIYRKSCGRNSTIFSSKNEAVCREIQMHLESSLSASLTKKLWAQFYDFCVKNDAVCCEVQTHFGSFRLARFVKKSCGCIFTMYASKNEVVCHEVKAHFGSSRFVRFQNFFVLFKDMCCLKFYFKFLL